MTPTPVPPTPTPVPPTPTPVPVVRPVAPPVREVQAAGPADPADVLALIASYPWPYDQAVAVARCESGLNPNAYNASGATGLFQIMHGSFDPAANVAAAYSKYQDGVSKGWPWYHWANFGPCGDEFGT